MPESLYKYASAQAAEIILTSGTMRWSSPALFDEPWAIPHAPNLGFDHLSITKIMLKTAVAMIFTRDLPSGSPEHPLYKAIRRWRAEDRFKDEVEAYDSLSELLAPTPETLEAKLNQILSSWGDLIANSRVLCMTETAKDVQSWKNYADNHRGVVLKFATDESFDDPKKVEYTTQRCQLTSIKEQVDDLVGIRRAIVIENFEAKMLTKSKYEASEREWRCIKLLAEEDLDCGEDIEDWYIDERFEVSELRAVYFGFAMRDEDKLKIAALVQSNYPTAALYNVLALEDQYELEFQKYSQ